MAQHPRPAARRAFGLRPGLPLVLAGSVLAVVTAWIALAIGGPHITDAVDDGSTAAAAALAAGCCAGAATRNVGRLRRFWILMALAALAWTLGEVTWAGYDLGSTESVPSPSFADIGYLAAIPLAVAALLVHPAERQPASTRVRAVLDGASVAVALLLLSWLFILQPSWVGARGVSAVSRIVTLAYPVGDVVILFLLFRMLHSLDGAARDHLRWIVAGLSAMAISDSGYSYLSGVRGYQTGHILDVGWIAGYLGLAIGGWYGRRAAPLEARGPATDPSALALLAPYAPLLVALIVIAVRDATHEPIDATSRVFALALVALVLARQAVSAMGLPGLHGRPHARGLQ